MKRHATLLSDRVRICETQAACEGSILRPHRTMCAPCERTLARRSRGQKALRGENYLNYREERKKL